MKKIGVLTSGGDAPGMNAAVVAVALNAAMYGIPLVGIKRGYNGLLRKSESLSDDMEELRLDTVLDIADRPGTYLRTARCAEFMDPQWRKFAADTLRAMDIGGLVVIGGDGSFQGARHLCHLGIPCIGIPGTIDNDLAYTEMTLGYDTAVNVCVDAVRAIRATSRSHDRPHVVEVMGRHCGDIALTTAVSTGAEIVLVPEVRWSVEKVAARLREQIAKGNYRTTIIVAEGCWESMEPFDMYTFLNAHGKRCYEGEPISAYRFASILKRMCGNVEARATVIGYTQRGEQPTARDSAFAFEAGNLAVRLLRDGISNQVVGMREGKVFYMSIDEALKEKRHFRRELYNLVNRM
ncbi:MAG: ATP-dependent 6-phosphofructokinase [Oscillospiraceae bacterium]|nr:ATP-dependent 6-phosphofructokinase [Oscillospiraceae bacterium]